MKIKISAPVALLAAVCLLLAGCSEKAQKPVPEDYERVVVPGLLVPRWETSYSDRGLVCFDRERPYGIASFFDPESGVKVPLCTRVNCPHNSSSCDAFFDSAYFVMPIGDSLYYVEDSNGSMGKQLCIADVSGTKRRVLHKLDSAQVISCAGYENGYVFLGYYNQYTDNGEFLEKRNSALCLMNLETEELEQIPMPENYESSVNRVTVCRDALYYMYFENEKDLNDASLEVLDWDAAMWEEAMEHVKLELWRYDFATKEKSCLWSKTGRQIDNVQLGFGFFYAGEFDGRARMENLSTGEVYELDAELTRDKAIVMCDEGVVLSGSDNQFMLWRYGTDKLEALSRCDEDLLVRLSVITEDWVYGGRYTRNPDGTGNILGNFYMPRDKFMRGEWEWRQL